MRAEEVGRIVARIASRYHPLASNYGSFTATSSAYTGATVLVRAGRRTIVGGSGPVPATLPSSGPLTVGTQQWWVVSFRASTHAPVYVLVPPLPAG